MVVAHEQMSTASTGWFKVLPLVPERASSLIDWLPPGPGDLPAPSARAADPDPEINECVAEFPPVHLRCAVR